MTDCDHQMVPYQLSISGWRDVEGTNEFIPREATTESVICIECGEVMEVPDPDDD